MAVEVNGSDDAWSLAIPKSKIFTSEPVDGARAGEERGEHDLERDLAVAEPVVDAVDRAHAARAEERAHDVAAREHGAGLEALGLRVRRRARALGAPVDLLHDAH